MKDYGCLIGKCDLCKRELLKFQITKSNEDLIEESKNPISTTLRVKCESCNFLNDPIKIDGQFYPGSVEDSIRFDVIEAEEDAGCDTVFKVLK